MPIRSTSVLVLHTTMLSGRWGGAGVNRSICPYLIYPLTGVCELRYRVSKQMSLSCLPRWAEGSSPPYRSWHHRRSTVWGADHHWALEPVYLGWNPGSAPLSQLWHLRPEGGFTSLGLRASYCVGELIAAPASEDLVKILSSFLSAAFRTYSKKAMATHSRVLAWRIPGMEDPGRLPSMGLHRVGHD